MSSGAFADPARLVENPESNQGISPGWGSAGRSYDRHGAADTRVLAIFPGVVCFVQSLFWVTKELLFFTGVVRDMVQGVLQWAAYLMIIAVTVTGLHQLGEVTSARRRAALKTILLPLIPVILYIGLYAVTAMPADIKQPGSIEIACFHQAMQAVMAGITVWSFVCVTGFLTVLTGKVAALLSRKPG